MLDKVFISQIKLRNFQKHSDLTLNFTSGVNIIYGRSDAGKSCIRRAVEWVIENKKIDGVRKVGTKETSVYILFNSGVGIEKVRSALINRYIIHKDGKEVKFDAIGKTVPEEVRNVIGISPIEIDGEQIYLNSTHQIGLPFLFDISPTERMKLFNLLTGNDLLDKLFVGFNKDILSLNRDLKETKILIENQVSALSEKEIEKEKLEAKLKKSKNSLVDIEGLYTSYQSFLQLQQLQQDTINKLAKVTVDLKSLIIPQDIDIKGVSSNIEVLKGLKSLHDALRATDKYDEISAQLTQINVPELDFAGSNDQIQALDKLQSLCYTYSEQNAQSEAVEFKLKKAEIDIGNLETEFKTLLKEAKVCPLCFSEITDKHVEGLKI